MLFEVNPARGAKFVRTIRLPGQPARVCRFNPGERIDLNREEQAFMRVEIENNVIGPAGKPFPPPPKPPRPKLYPGETPRDENFDLIEESTIELSGWQRCQRDIERWRNGAPRY